MARSTKSCAQNMWLADACVENMLTSPMVNPRTETIRTWEIWQALLLTLSDNMFVAYPSKNQLLSHIWTTVINYLSL